MGLDSVELVMDFEDFFDLQIPDSEAEKMRTIQNVVDYVAAHITYNEHGFDIKNVALNSLSKAFLSIGKHYLT